MDMEFQQRFQDLWSHHFDGVDLPICSEYVNDVADPETLVPAPPGEHTCVIGQLARVRRGEDLCFGIESLGCFGGKRYLGLTDEVTPNFDHFLSYGIEGKLEGERYKKTPQIVREAMGQVPHFEAPATYLKFKRWDRLTADDEPEVVIFFATPDVLSGLFTLSNFDETDPNAIMAPFAAGCGTIIHYPYLERQKAEPRSVIGMFDVSARPFVPADRLSFATPMAKFERMVANMPESFLITGSWARVRRRIENSTNEG